VRIVAVQTEGVTGSGRFTHSLIDFSDDHGLSVAYSANSGSGVVALHDPSLRYESRSGALFAPLVTSGSKPAAVLSTSLSQAAGVRSGLLADGVKMVGTFQSDVQFDSRYPAVLENMAGAQPGSGVYLIAGLAESDRTRLALFFSQNGIEVKDLTVQTPVGAGYILSTLYGGIVMAFALLSALAALLVTHVHSFLFRRHLTIAVVLGATTGDLRRLLLGRLIPLVVAGTSAGVLAGLGVFLSLRPVMQISPATIGHAWAVSLTACALLWAAILTWVSWWETRRCHGALSR
jgi:hypothetical protein